MFKKNRLISSKTCNLTQWFCHIPMTTAGPKDLAGFMLAPVNLIAAKCPAVIDNPIAKGTDPLMSDRRSSQTPCTTKTNKNVMRASIITPWYGLTSCPKFDTPKPPTYGAGVASWNC